MGLDNPLHIAFLVVILLLVFGARRLPEIGRSLGSGLREFKQSLGGEPSQPALPPASEQPQEQPQRQPTAAYAEQQPAAAAHAEQQPATAAAHAEQPTAAQAEQQR